MGKTVSIGRLGEEIRTFALDDNATVDDLLAVAGITLEKGESLAVDGESVRGSYVPENGETVYIVPSITGGY